MMQKFEESFDCGFNSSDKKVGQGTQTKKTKIVINVAGILMTISKRPNMRS